MKKTLLIALALTFCLSLTAYAKGAVSHADCIAEIHDQQATSQCGTYAAITAMEMTLTMRGYDLPQGGFNADWLYELAKVQQPDGSYKGANSDAVINAVNKYGILPNYANNYEPEQKLNEALKYKTKGYATLPTSIDGFKDELKDNVILVAIRYRERMWNDGDAYISPTSETYDGYHAAVLIGYDDSKRQFIGVNSWGEDWGDNGLFYYSYDCIDDIVQAYEYNIPHKPKQRTMRAAMKVENGVTMLPMRDIYEALGATVTWNNGKATATLTINGKTVSIETTNGSDIMQITSSPCG